MRSTRTGHRWAAMMVAAMLMMMAAAIAAPAQTFKTLVNFNGSNGGSPLASVVQGADGNLYGTTESGTPGQSWGTVFKVTPVGTLTTIYRFCAQPACADGSTPRAGLVLAADGNFYGTTSYGGTKGDGTIFKITPAGTLTTLHSLGGYPYDGAYPAGGLIQAADGNFYGTTNFGGSYNRGTVFKVTPAGALTMLHSFHSEDGCYPYGALVQSTDGNFYGTTSSGGGAGCSTGLCGTVFRVGSKGVFATLHSFDLTDGGDSVAGLIQGSDGNFYGTTSLGGAYGDGTIFQITSEGTLTTLHSFDSTDGSNAGAALIQATDGNFYGTTMSGADNGNGTVFEITPSGMLTTLHSFDSIRGGRPGAALVEATNGGFYGTTLVGGTSKDGTVFALSVGLGAFVETVPTVGKVGQSVTLLGTNLTGAMSVTFNGTASTFTVQSGTAIKTTVPTGATTGPIQVVTPTGTLTSNVSFQVLP